VNNNVDDHPISILDLHILYPQLLEIARVALLDPILLCSTTFERGGIVTAKI
jgi:hypothetical protein